MVYSKKTADDTYQKRQLITQNRKYDQWYKTGDTDV